MNKEKETQKICITFSFYIVFFFIHTRIYYSNEGSMNTSDKGVDNSLFRVLIETQVWYTYHWTASGLLLENPVPRCTGFLPTSHQLTNKVYCGICVYGKQETPMYTLTITVTDSEKPREPKEIKLFLTNEEYTKVVQCLVSIQKTAKSLEFSKKD